MDRSKLGEGRDVSQEKEGVIISFLMHLIKFNHWCNISSQQYTMKENMIGHCKAQKYPASLQLFLGSV